MTNVYLAIDPSWSYKFFKGLDEELNSHNAFKLTDLLYRLLSDYIKLTHNYRVTNASSLYNAALHSIWVDLEKDTDIPVPYVQVNFRQLFTAHMAMFNAIDKPIESVHMVTNDTGDLQGFVCTTV